MAFQPPEIIFEILSRLPAKPVLRFRCVSKQWCDLIDSPYFVSNHSTKINTNNLRLLVSDLSCPQFYSVCEKKNNSSSNNKQLVAVKLFPPMIETLNHRFVVVGSCNGLLCLFFRPLFVIWNPTTGKHWFTPHNPYIREPYEYSSGFGYASQSDDYKIVMISQWCDHGGCWVTPVDVYSLRSNSWMRVQLQGLPDDMSIRLLPAVLVNECLHWLAKMSMGDQIFAFEIGSESFRMVSLPDIEDVMVPGANVSIMSLSGCLCGCVRDYYNRYDLSFHVWVMKEYGVKESWTKLFKVEYSEYFEGWNIWPLRWELITYDRDGDMLLLGQHSPFGKNRILSYDLVRKKYEEVEIHNIPDCFSVVCYSESLVNPKGGALHDGQK